MNETEIAALEEMCYRQLDRCPVHARSAWSMTHYEYLRDHLPTLCSELVEAGLIDLRCLAVASRAAERKAELVEAGVDPELAQELVMTRYIRPPTEEEAEAERRYMEEIRKDAQQELASQVVNTLAK